MFEGVSSVCFERRMSDGSIIAVANTSSVRGSLFADGVRINHLNTDQRRHSEMFRV